MLVQAMVALAIFVFQSSHALTEFPISAVTGTGGTLGSSYVYTKSIDRDLSTRVVVYPYKVGDVI